MDLGSKIRTLMLKGKVKETNKYPTVHIYIIILLFILFSIRKNYVIWQVLTRDQTKMVKFMIGRDRIQTQICLC